jgi:hypothetical protein
MTSTNTSFQSAAKGKRMRAKPPIPLPKDQKKAPKTRSAMPGMMMKKKKKKK